MYIRARDARCIKRKLRGTKCGDKVFTAGKQKRRLSLMRIIASNAENISEARMYNQVEVALFYERESFPPLMSCALGKRTLIDIVTLLRSP